jgi:primosomal protein N' (replication factor Y)
MSYAEIIIDHKSTSVDRRFTYNIPKELVDDANIGVRVVVPFGRYNKPTMGIIVEKTESLKSEFKTKDILQILDDKPLISKERLDLAEWIKEEYLCTGFESLQPLLPPGDFRDISTIVLVKNDFERYDLLSENGKKILNQVLDAGRVEYSKLRDLYDDMGFNKEISSLEEAGAVELVLQVRKNTTARIEKYVVANPEITYPQGIQIAGKAAKKQLEIWEYINKVNESPAKGIMLDFSTSLSVLKAMEKKNLIRIENRIVNEKPIQNRIPVYKRIELNKEQREVYEGIISSQNNLSLIHGITGSGKTEIYLQLVEEMLHKGKNSIILVPEISLTPQTTDRFVGRFGDQVAILHSKLTQLERFDQWRRIKAGEYNIVIGARSALFAPFSNLGLIVIDEEHENTYKSSNNPKYSTAEVAKKISELEGAKLVLGTATPSVETYYRAELGEFQMYRLSSRATRYSLPSIKVVDMRMELQEGNRSIFSRDLYNEMEKNLKTGNQTILFLNRRGYTGFITCRSCGYVARCNKCDISLTYHRSSNRLRCHYCGETQTIPKVCPSCGSKYFKSFGIGTEKVEEEVKRLFPNARTSRMDSDSIKTREDYEVSLEAMKRREIDILIGTQMISKGLDFPSVTLVGIIAADTTLNLPDFRSPERTFQLITQVAGRAGRGDAQGNVILQTYNPDHYSITAAMNSDYRRFFQSELELRREFGYPPFKDMASITLFGRDYGKVRESTEKSSLLLMDLIREAGLTDVDVLGPNPSPMEKINNNYRWQILLKFGYNHGIDIRKIIRRVYTVGKGNLIEDDVKISIDINPSSIL